MKSPREIATTGVEEEIRARAGFSVLLQHDPAEARSFIEDDPSLQTDAMARHILDYCQAQYTAMPQEQALELIRAADFAARDGDAHIRLRIAKDLANTYRYLGRFCDAERALRKAECLVPYTFARDIHEAVVEFACLVFDDDTGRNQDFDERTARLIQRFDANSAADRAFAVRQYDAVMKFRRGQYLSALAAFRDASERAAALGSLQELALAVSNTAHCYRALGDWRSAQTHFMKAAKEFRSLHLTINEAVALRCAARMAIRIEGERGIDVMERVKAIFLGLGMAGEVCRCTLAVMEELTRSTPSRKLTDFASQLREDAVSLGVMPIAQRAIELVDVAISDDQVTNEVLAAAWSAFAPTFGLHCVSAAKTVAN